MGFINSLKKLFGTSKEVAEAKTAELKEKTAESIESAKGFAKEAKEKVGDVMEDTKDKVGDVMEDARELATGAKEKINDMGETLREKTSEVMDKLDEKASSAVDKLEGKLRSTIDKPEITAVEPEVVETPADTAPIVVPNVTDAAKDVTAAAEETFEPLVDEIEDFQEPDDEPTK